MADEKARRSTKKANKQLGRASERASERTASTLDTGDRGTCTAG